MPRPAACALALVLTLSSSFVPRVSGDPQPDLASALDQAAAGVPGMVSVVVVDLDSGYVYERRADERVEAASLFKLFVMAALYRRALDDPQLFEATVPVSRPRLTAGQVDYALEPVAVREGLEAMIDWSDNEATAALVELLGTDEVNATIASLGLQDSVVRSGEASGNSTSARDIGRFLTLLARREIVSPEASDAMTWLLLRQGINDRLSLGMPKDALFAHKTGNSAGTFHDAGIAWTAWGERVLVVLTDGVAAPDARALMKDLGYWAYVLPAPVAAARSGP